MAKLKLTDLRGLEAEQRFIDLARSLKDTKFVRSVKRAPRTLDKHGIDIILFVHPLNGGRDIKVPIQVKSSVTGVFDYYKKHPLCTEAGVIIIVVNEKITDDSIVAKLRRKLEDIQWNNSDFSALFSKIRDLEKGED